MTDSKTDQLRYTLLQYAPEWENPVANRDFLKGQIDLITEPSDLFVLPEMFQSGFTNNPERVKETMTGETIRWMQHICKEKTAAICGSLVIEENGRFYNRFVFISPGNKPHIYDKKHLFTMSGENHHYMPGNQRITIEYKGWKILPAICYDIRFPVWLRNNDDYDLLLVVANWPESRKEVWEILLKARAIENQCFVLGCNRSGMDDNRVIYCGNSMAIDTKGNILNSADSDNAQICGTLFHQELQNFRKSFPVLNDRDTYKISDKIS